MNMKFKQLRQRIPAKQKLIIRSVLILLFTLIVAVIWVSCGYYSPYYFLSENQNLYIFSTQAQVVGAIYGLTITGYTFLRNNQDKQIESDPSMKDPIIVNQKEERILLYSLTIISVLTILLSIFALITLEDVNKDLRVVSKNLSSALFFVNILLFAYFILYFLRLDKIEKASEEIKNVIDEQENRKENNKSSSCRDSEIINNDVCENLKDLNPVPSLTDFLIYFNSIEEWLNILMENHIKKTNIEYQRLNLNLQSDKYKNRFRLTVSRILKDLVSLGVIGSDLEKELSEIIKYRNALVHGNNLKPSDLMYNKIKSVAEKVERLL
ncbi:hypothetical protein [Cronobacter sakazakii]|uniref:hypothetical protein n=3 Tax=Cronobacter sakazakii TaxID=28141 RepID=UPI00029C1FDD|nr:hypothetical protein [Cronobacter sakazakii]CCK06629.1 hypothetical protein BN128_454 [Cronobacter sakazakii 696]ELY6404481.1 hypothetical protein [Cronobacter sakazakii]MBF4816333.1 hypothetical protein [Cronobacter sakazakii]MDT3568020.1 hypothetical protein [Cronobacter sakazakii]NCH65486.1 hypothetical protein [Cronobacter sakazakii]